MGDRFVLQNKINGSFFRFIEHGNNVNDVIFASRLTVSDLSNVNSDLSKRCDDFLQDYNAMLVVTKLIELHINLEDEIKKEKKRVALAKLTAEEKQLLGLT